MTLNVPLFSSYRILSDKYQYILAKEENGRLIHQGFYPRLDDLLNSFLQRQIRLSDCSSIQELKNEMKRLGAELNRALIGTELKITMGVEE